MADELNKPENAFHSYTSADNPGYHDFQIPEGLCGWSSQPGPRGEPGDLPARDPARGRHRPHPWAGGGPATCQDSGRLVVSSHTPLQVDATDYMKPSQANGVASGVSQTSWRPLEP